MYEYRTLSYDNPFHQDRTVVDVLKRLIHQVQSALGYGQAITMIYDEASETLNLGPGCETLMEDYTGFLRDVQLGKGCNRLAALERKVVIIPDAQKCDICTLGCHIQSTWIRSAWTLPIIFEEHLFGTMSIYHSETGVPDDKDIQLAQWFVGYAATALAGFLSRYWTQKEEQFKQRLWIINPPSVEEFCTR